MYDPQYDPEAAIPLTSGKSAKSADSPPDFGATVAECSAYVQRGFLRKVFGLVATQLAVTAALAACFCFVPTLRTLSLTAPSLQLVAFVAAFGFLFACHAYKDSHPTNLYCLGGFTLGMAWSVATVCARFYAAGLGLIVVEAVALTASVTAGLTAYTLSSKQVLTLEPPCPPPPCSPRSPPSHTHKHTFSSTPPGRDAETVVGRAENKQRSEL